MTLFKSVELRNTSEKSKKPIEVLVHINFHSKDIFLAKGSKTMVESFIHPESHLLISSKYTEPGFEQTNAHYEFMKLAQSYARQECAKMAEEILTMDPVSYQTAGYKLPEQFKSEMTSALDDDIKLWGNITKELNLLRTTLTPDANTEIVFQNEDPQGKLVTQTLPYPKPIQQKSEDVSRFLHVFFNDEDSEYFSWYMGAMLLNKPISDYTVSKMIVMSSSVGGVGKSTLLSALTKHVFTPTYAATVADYDSYFLSDSKFGTSYLPNRRITVFLESAWGKEGKDGHQHDFTGMNTNAIKSIIADGYIDEEEKFGDKVTTQNHSGQVVLTNYMPKIKESDDALNRRILPIIVKPTSMVEKVKELDLYGERFDNWVAKHREELAGHFMATYLESPNLVMDYVYDHKEYVQELEEDKDVDDISIAHAPIKQERRVRAVLNYIHNIYPIDELLKLIDEKPSNNADVRFDSDAVWINSALSYLATITEHPEQVRELLKFRYGNPQKKYGKRRFKCAK